MIDWTRVSELRDEVGAEDFDEVVDLFLLEVDEEINFLKKQLTPQTLAEKLHFLKGSALSLGFAEFSQMCASAEHEVSGATGTEINVDAIIDSYTTSRAHFMAELPGHISN